MTTMETAAHGATAWTRRRSSPRSSRQGRCRRPRSSSSGPTTSGSRGTHSRTTIADFFGVGEERSHEREFVFTPTTRPSSSAATTDRPGRVRAPRPGGLPHRRHRRTSRPPGGSTLTEVRSTVTGDIDLNGILGLHPEVRNGYQQVTVKFVVKGDAPRGRAALARRAVAPPLGPLRRHHRPTCRSGSTSRWPDRGSPEVGRARHGEHRRAGPDRAALSPSGRPASVRPWRRRARWPRPGRLVLVTGPAGAGKTRRASRWRRRRAPPGHGRRGPPVAGPGAPPFWPWRQALRALPGEAGDAEPLPAIGLPGRRGRRPAGAVRAVRGRRRRLAAAWPSGGRRGTAV